MEIPKGINDVLHDLGFNQAECIEQEGKTYWFLGLVDDNGEPIPTGKPVVYIETNDRFIQLDFEKVSQLLRNL